MGRFKKVMLGLCVISSCVCGFFVYYERDTRLAVRELRDDLTREKIKLEAGLTTKSGRALAESMQVAFDRSDINRWAFGEKEAASDFELQKWSAELLEAKRNLEPTDGLSLNNVEQAETAARMLSARQELRLYKLVVPALVVALISAWLAGLKVPS